MTSVNVSEVLDQKISAIIVLNAGPLPERLRNFWPRAGLRVCADGGANQLLRRFGTELVPDAIVGDLDSLEAETKTTWENMGVRVEQVSCQNSTDLDKCFRYMKDHGVVEGVTLVVGTLGAQRLDQLMAVINTCFCMGNVVILGEECLTLIFKAGVNCVRFPQWLVDENRCGLIPMFCPVHAVSTTGLKWELRDEPTRFGFLVSSSNEVVSQTLTVQTTQPLLFALHHPLL